MAMTADEAALWPPAVTGDFTAMLALADLLEEQGRGSPRQRALRWMAAAKRWPLCMKGLVRADPEKVHFVWVCKGSNNATASLNLPAGDRDRLRASLPRLIFRIGGNPSFRSRGYEFHAKPWDCIESLGYRLSVLDAAAAGRIDSVP